MNNQGYSSARTWQEALQLYFNITQIAAKHQEKGRKVNIHLIIQLDEFMYHFQ